MKKIFLLFGLVLVVVVLLGADIRRKKQASETPVVEKKPCYGYTIIEFGKGVDCQGDQEMKKPSGASGGFFH